METGRTRRETSSPVTGWRAWVMAETAECLRHEDPFVDALGPHPVPAAQCNCGFHAARDPVDALSYARGRDEPGTVCRILGEVALWGHVLQTQSGWRASHA